MLVEQLLALFEAEQWFWCRLEVGPSILGDCIHIGTEKNLILQLVIILTRTCMIQLLFFNWQHFRHIQNVQNLFAFFCPHKIHFPLSPMLLFLFFFFLKNGVVLCSWNLWFLWSERVIFTCRQAQKQLCRLINRSLTRQEQTRKTSKEEEEKRRKKPWPRP